MFFSNSYFKRILKVKGSDRKISFFKRGNKSDRKIFISLKFKVITERKYHFRYENSVTIGQNKKRIEKNITVYVYFSNNDK